MPSSPGMYGTRLMFVVARIAGRVERVACAGGLDAGGHQRPVSLSADAKIEVGTDLEDRVRAVERVEVEARRTRSRRSAHSVDRDLDADLAHLGRIVGGVEAVGEPTRAAARRSCRPSA